MFTSVVFIIRFEFNDKVESRQKIIIRNLKVIKSESEEVCFIQYQFHFNVTKIIKVLAKFLSRIKT